MKQDPPQAEPAGMPLAEWKRGRVAPACGVGPALK